MTIRTLAASALCAAASVSSLQAQIAHTHVTSIAPANGEGEIVAHDPVTGTFWVTNPGNDTLNTYVVDASSGAPVLTASGSIPLAGAPGCFVLSSGNLGFWGQPILAGGSRMAFGIPSATALLGAELYAQGAASDLGNALGLATSNGVFARVGQN